MKSQFVKFVKEHINKRFKAGTNHSAIASLTTAFNHWIVK